MTAKEMVLFDNDTNMNNALSDIRANVKITQFFRPQMVSLARDIARGETVLFEIVKNDLFQTSVEVIGFLLKSDWFKKLTKEQKEIVVWQWYYNKVMDYYYGMTKRKG